MNPVRAPQSDGAFDTADYEDLLAFRDGLRRFLRWSDDRAKAAGITASQHQLLLAIKGHRGPSSVSDIASHLLLRHHSVVELVDRAEAAGLVEREGDDRDHRVVRVHLSAIGEQKLRSLTEAHIEELSRVGATFAGLWRRLPTDDR